MTRERPKYSRAALLESLDSLTAHISPNRFVQTRPVTTAEPMDDFILTRLPQSIAPRGDADRATIGQIAVFARDIRGGLEDTMRLDEMQQAVTDLFPIIEKRYTATRPLLLPGGSDGTGFHSLIIQFEIQLKD